MGRRDGYDGSDLQTLEGQPGTRGIIQIMGDVKDQNQNPIARVRVRQEEGLCNGPRRVPELTVVQVWTKMLLS